MRRYIIEKPFHKVLIDTRFWSFPISISRGTTNLLISILCFQYFYSIDEKKYYEKIKKQHVLTTQNI